MLQKDTQKTVFISAYKVCKGSKLNGTGIASQQYRAMVRDGTSEKNQRQKFDKEQGTEVCLAMDSNTWSTSEEMSTFLANTGMLNAYDLLYEGEEDP